MTRFHRILLVGLILTVLLAGLVAWLIVRGADRRVEGEYFESIGGVRIHYTDQGRGEPVVLIHGLAANVDWNWRVPGVIKALKPHYRVIALDNRGHGLSGKPHEPEAYGALLAEDVVALLDHLEIEKAHVVGYSLGGFITLKLMATHPDRLISAMPCGMSWRPVSEDDPKLDFLGKLANSMESGKGITPLMKRIHPEGSPNFFRVQFVNFTLNRTNDMQALAAVTRSLYDLQVTEEELAQATMPVKSIVGSKDPLGADLEELARVLPNHEFQIIEGSDHITTVKRREFIAGILEFLDRHRME